MRTLCTFWIGILTATGVTTAMAATETVLYSFPTANMGNPIGRLHYSNGSLFGTASGFTAGDGQVFQLKPSRNGWKFKTLLAFNSANGSIPRAGLVEDASGALYGTTAEGGQYGGGTVFKLSKSGGSWTGETIWSFGAKEEDGLTPQCDLVFDEKGALYGTTLMGGTNHEGVVFKLDRSHGAWNEQVLYRFTNGGDGYEPVAGLLMPKPGVLIGTTFKGGFSDNGTAFQLTRSGSIWNEQLLHGFGNHDGVWPLSRLIQGPHGTLYGTALFAGLHGDGTVFELSQADGAWKATVLHDFASFGGADGEQPYGGIVRAADGTLYGTAEYGGANGGGIVYSLKKSGDQWTETVQHNFTGGNDGANPTGAITLDENGNLYGTTFFGGAHGNGTIWQITP